MHSIRLFLGTYYAIALRCACIVITLSTLCACASSPPVSGAFTAEREAIVAIDTITILPIVCTAKTDPAQMEKLLDKVYSRLSLDLAFKNYVLRRERSFSSENQLDGAQVAAMTPEQMATLGPKDSNYILICFLGNVDTSYVVVAKSSNASLSMVLIDKQKKSVLWRNTSKSTVTLNILFDAGYLILPFLDTESAAISQGFSNLLDTFPSKPQRTNP